MKTIKKTGFTLIEVLTVVFIIGLLFGLLYPAFLKVMESAKRQRRDVEKQTLSAAFWAYRHEYGEWPLDGSQTVYSNDNYNVIKHLLPDDEDNPKKVEFIKLSDYKIDGNSNVISPVSREPYVIEFHLTNDKVTVTAPE